MGQAKCLSARYFTVMTAARRKKKRREKLGRWAEFLAAQYLRLKGYRVLERRYKTKAGEIDLIVARKDLLVMVEVKARKDLLTAREAISFASQKRIKKAAQVFIGRKPAYQQMGLRFDAVFLLGKRRIIHEPDFFR